MATVNSRSCSCSGIVTRISAVRQLGRWLRLLAFCCRHHGSSTAAAGGIGALVKRRRPRSLAARPRPVSASRTPRSFL